VNITLLPSINPIDYAAYARAAVEEGVRIFETAGNNRASFTTLATRLRLGLRLIADIVYVPLAKPLITYFKSQDCIVIHKCTTIRHAKVSHHSLHVALVLHHVFNDSLLQSAQKMGVDVISMDGFECVYRCCFIYTTPLLI
jgi:NAD(P)H-dependent flavin oxidoreductase YrpB (nitropropane dioxygenase family)